MNADNITHVIHIMCTNLTKERRNNGGGTISGEI